MAISFPVSFPSSSVIEKCTVIARSIVGKTQSPFSGAQQIQAHQGQWWELEYGIGLSNRADISVVQAMLLSLNGGEKTVLASDPAATTARGSASTTPGILLVNGSGQTGSTLICKGAPNNVTGYLLTGDYIQLGTVANSRLYQILVDANSDGSGNIIFEIWPNLRSSPANNDSVIVDSAQSVFRLNENSVSWQESTVLNTISFKLMEAI